MYTQILKEILFTIDFEQSHIDEFHTYCREQFVDKSIALINIEKLRKWYLHHQTICWYSMNLFSILTSVNRWRTLTLTIPSIVFLSFFDSLRFFPLSSRHGCWFSFIVFLSFCYVRYLNYFPHIYCILWLLFYFLQEYNIIIYMIL